MTNANSAELPPISEDGLTTIWDQATEEVNNQVREKPNACDFLFVHGLAGDGKTTWTSKKTSFYWPWRLGSDIDSARVGTFSYLAKLLSWNKNEISVSGLSARLKNALYEWRRKVDPGRPLVVIAHSLGGLVVKRAIFDMHRDRHSGVTNSIEIPVLNNALGSLAGLIFLGVPHLGSRINEKSRVRIIEVIAKIAMSKPSLLTDALKSESEELRNLCENFEKTPMFTQSQIVVYSYYETLSGKEGDVIVSRDSATMHVPGETVVSISKTHQGIAKFDALEDADYKTMIGTIEGVRDFGIQKKENRPEFLVPLLNLEAEEPTKSIRRHLKFAFEEAGTMPKHWYSRSIEFRAWMEKHKSSMLWHIENDESSRTHLLKQLYMSLDTNSHLGSLITFHVPPDGEQIFDNRVSIYRSLLAHFCSYFTNRCSEAPVRVLDRIGAWDGDAGCLHERGRILCNQSLKNPISAFELLQRACKGTPGTIYILVSVQDAINLGEDAALLKDLWHLLSIVQNPAVKAQCALKIFVTSRLLQDKDIPAGIPITDIETDRRNCLESLRVNFRCDRPDLAKAEAGTNMWLEKHEEYRKWQEGSHSGILWLEGEAGCGKSTLIATILQEVEARRHFSSRPACVSEDSEDDSKNNGPAFLKIRHCYDAANQGSNAASHLAMLRSILFQLLSQCKDLFSSVRLIFQDLPGTTTGAREWTLADLRNAFRNITTSLVSAEKNSRVDYWVVLLVDAFDESETSDATRSAENPRSQALKILRSCCTSRGTVRFKLIMSSRPLEDPTIRAMVKKFAMLKVQDYNSPDVTAVIDAKMRELSNALRSSPLSYTEDQIGHYQETARKSASSVMQLARATKTEQSEYGGFLGMVARYARQYHGGIILWVKIMSDEMIDFCLKTARTSKNVADKLADVPKSLKEFYKKMVEQLVHRLDHHNDDALSSDFQSARTLITWACFAERALTLGELRDIMACASFTEPLTTNSNFNEELRLNNRALWEGMRQSIRHHCGNLLRISQATSPWIKIFRSESKQSVGGTTDEFDEVTILHLSLGQYLRASKEEKVRLVCLPEADAQAFMVMSMRNYLVMALRPDTLAAKDPSKWVETDFNNFIIHLNDRPFLPYVLKYLPDLFQNLPYIDLSHGYNSNDFWGYLSHEFSDPNERLSRELLSVWISSSYYQRTYHYRSSDEFRRSCLVKAIENGHLIALTTLLDLGIDPNEPLSMEENDYPLTLAIKKRSIAMVMLILLSGVGRIEPNKRTPITHDSPEPAKPAYHPLKAAIELQDLDMLDFLLQGDSDLGIRGQIVDDVDLWQAVDLQRDDILEKLHQSHVRSHASAILLELQFPGHNGKSGTRLVPALFDTGSDRNILTYCVVAKLGLEITLKSGAVITTIGQKVQIHGTANCSYRLENSQVWLTDEFWIMPEELQSSPYLIIGSEALMR